MPSDTKPDKPRVKRVFISYGRDELVSLANKLKGDLTARGYDVWFDADRLKPGYDWEHYIEEGLNWVSLYDGGCVILLMTPHSVRRPDGFCLNELARAIQKTLKIIPIMLIWCEPPLSICRMQWLDMMDCIPVEERLERYDVKLKILLEALEHNRLDFEGFHAALIDILRPLSFDADINNNLEGFTGREWVIGEVDRWLSSGRSRIFWITGSPGSGKTAISAWVCAHYREVAAFHFCRYDNVQKIDPRRCVMSIAYQLSTQLPDYTERLKYHRLDNVNDLNAKTLFDHLIVQPLSGIPKPDRKITILIDALDEATVDGGNELASFIATEFERTPEWLRLFITSRPDPEILGPLQAYTPFMLDLLDPRNQQDIRAYLARELSRFNGGKGVPASTLDAIVKKSEGLFLYAEWIAKELDYGRLSLDRLREFPHGIGGIYLNFFERQFPDMDEWEKDIRPALEVVSALQEPLRLKSISPIFGWSVHDERRFRKSLGSLFSFDEGVVRPFHKSVIEWLTNEDKHDPYFISVLEGHKILAEHGWRRYKRGIESWSPYLLTYLPMHLCMAGRQKDLEEALGNTSFIAAVWGRDKFTVLKQWTFIEEHTSLKMADTYRRLVEDPGSGSDKDLLAIADLFKSSFHFDEALKISGYLITHYRQTGDLRGLQAALGIRAWILYVRGDFDGSMGLFKEQETICREIGDISGLQYAIRNEANILSYRNDFERAMALFKEQEAICRETGNKDGLLESLGDQCFVLRFKGDFEGMLKLLKDREAICQETGNRNGSIICLFDHGCILRNKGDLDAAMECFMELERICREIGNKEYLRCSFACREVILRWQGELGRAAALNEEEERLCRSIGSMYDLQECIGERAINLRHKGDLDAALALIDEREGMCRRLGNRFGLQVCHGERGLIMLEKGDPDGAMALLTEQEQICREIGHRRDLAMSLGSQAIALRRKGDLNKAKELHDEAVKTLREMGYKYGLQEAIGNQAMTLNAMGDKESALSLLREQEKMCREMGAKPDLEKCLNNQRTVSGENEKSRDNENRLNAVPG